MEKIPTIRLPRSLPYSPWPQGEFKKSSQPPACRPAPLKAELSETMEMHARAELWLVIKNLWHHQGVEVVSYSTGFVNGIHA